MNESILERLFYHVIGDRALYTEHNDRAASESLSSTLKALNLDFSDRNSIEEQFANAENAAELHGFEQGFKLGIRLAAELSSNPE